MPHAGRLFRGGDVAARRLEEAHDGVVREIRGVREVDDDLRAGKSFGKPFSGDGVDAGVGRRRDHLMALLTQVRHDLAADEAGAADNNDLHVCFSMRGVVDGGRLVEDGPEDFVAPSKLP